MNRFQGSVAKMTYSSLSLLSQNSAIVAVLPNCSQYISFLQSSLVQLQAAFAQQEADKSGDTDSKRLLRKSLTTQSIDLACRVTAYAMNTNNSALMALVNYSESDLSKVSDTKFIGITQVIHDTTNAQINNLQAYGVTSNLLSAQQAGITAYTLTIPKERVDKTDTGSATKLIASLISSILSTWKKVDVLVEMVRLSNPTFYNEYKSVRKVIDTGGNSLSLKVKVLDAESAVGIGNVKLTLSHSGMLSGASNAASKTIKGVHKKLMVKKTASAGGSNYKSIPDGDYEILAEKPGFKSVSALVSVVNGEATVLKIILEKA